MNCPQCAFENPDDSRYCSRCGNKISPSGKIAFTRDALLALTREFKIGSIFAGRYLIIEELGKGGMGSVYKVLDKEVDEKIALKLLNPEVASNEKTIMRFRNELKTARKISHKNVCRIYDLSKEQGIYYITMEYVSGEDLKSMVRMMGQLSMGKALFIAEQICEGLAEAHKKGIVHRDLKP
ncbi:MAG: protein kinase, partial [Candidatus Aminicenantes bacterium]|nr:protein kinase [Candidatus Aminicenantes bacterium]